MQNCRAVWAAERAEPESRLMLRTMGPIPVSILRSYYQGKQLSRHRKINYLMAREDRMLSSFLTHAVSFERYFNGSTNEQLGSRKFALYFIASRKIPKHMFTIQL